MENFHKDIARLALSLEHPIPIFNYLLSIQEASQIQDVQNRISDFPSRPVLPAITCIVANGTLCFG